jgi:transcriptional regulator with XRE-family HTH domain
MTATTEKEIKASERECLALRRFRISSRITFQELARKTGKSIGWLNTLERGFVKDAKRSDLTFVRAAIESIKEAKHDR